jgi:hypothetical protein
MIVGYVDPRDGGIRVETNMFATLVVEDDPKRGVQVVRQFDAPRSISSALNEQTGRWETNEQDFRGLRLGALLSPFHDRRSVASCFNPTSGKVEHAKASGDHAIAMAYNPRTQQMETRTERGYGLVGYFDETLGAVRWHKEPHSSMFAVWRDGAGKFHVSSPYYAEVVNRPKYSDFRMH